MGRLLNGIPLLDKDGQPLGEVPNILMVYLFCSPSLDLTFRCLPRAGGYYDQYYVDMMYFGIIENRIREVRNREASKQASAVNNSVSKIRTRR